MGQRLVNSGISSGEALLKIRQQLGPKIKIIVDGGVSMPIPISPLAESCDVTVAVDIGIYKFDKLTSPNAKSIKIRSDIITSNRLKLKQVSDADLVIRPDTKGLHWSRFDAGEILLENGKREGRKQMPFLNDLIRKKSGKLANKE